MFSYTRTRGTGTAVLKVCTLKYTLGKFLFDTCQLTVVQFFYGGWGVNPNKHTHMVVTVDFGISFFSDRSFLVANAQQAGCNIIYCSDGFCHMTGYSRAEVMQRPAICEFLQGPMTSQHAVSVVKEALAAGIERHFEILYYRKDGESVSFFQIDFETIVYNVCTHFTRKITR